MSRIGPYADRYEDRRAYYRKVVMDAELTVDHLEHELIRVEQRLADARLDLENAHKSWERFIDREAME